MKLIPGLDEDWTLGGANLLEWMAGFMALIIASEVVFTGKMTRSMPALMTVWVSVTFGLAALRKMFPDGQRGLMNKVLVSVGVCPPNLPAPAVLRPFWSGFPLRELAPDCKLKQLGIEEALDFRNEDESRAFGAEAAITRSRGEDYEDKRDRRRMLAARGFKKQLKVRV